MSDLRKVPVAVMMVRGSEATRVKAYPIICGRCKVRDGMTSGHFRRVPWAAYADHFMHKGWDVGRKPAEDRCPECIKTETEERRSKHHKSCAAPPRKQVAASPPVVPIDAPQPAYHFGPSYAQLRALQHKFNHQPGPANGHSPPISELDQIRARLTRLENEPKPPSVEALEARIEQLERDVQLLLERLTQPAPEPAPEPAPAPIPEPPIEQPKAPARGHCYGNPTWLWRALRYDEFTPLHALAKATSRKSSRLAVILNTWKGRGYLDHKPFVGWRKNRKVEELDRMPARKVAA